MAIERRTRADDVEHRDDGGGSIIRGHAAVYDEWYTLYEDRDYVVRERIIPGAFDSALKENHDVRALFNHDSNYILGRTKAGTLRLKTTERGLFYEADPPKSMGMVVESLQRKDVDGSSFAFTIRTGGEVVTYRRDKETGKYIINRDIQDVNLFDVGPVTFPAYRTTDSSVRTSAATAEEFIKSVLDEARKDERARRRMVDMGRRLRLSGASLD